jgi:putative chitinase
MGNGNESSGDGWKYRGRGLIQIRGHDNYKAYGQVLNKNLIDNPDLLCENSEIIVSSACWYWSSRNLNDLADKDDILGITVKICGGTNGLGDRKYKLMRVKQVFSFPPP